MNQYKIVVTYEKKTNPKPTVLYRSTDFPNESTRQVGQRDFQDVLILYNEEEETVIVTDSNNNCINSFIDTPQGPLHNTLLLDSWPWGVTRLKDNIVLVAVPGSHQIVTVEASRELTLVSTVQTDKEYYSLAIIGTDWIAAGSDYSVDIVNMNGEFIRCLTPPGSVSYPWYMCVGTWGQLVVSDSLKKTVTCWTVTGELEWTYSSTEDGELTDPRGVKTTREGDFIVVDNQLKKVIVLSMSGQYLRDVLTSKDGLMSPTGIFDNGNGSIYVCEDTLVKEFLTIGV